MLFDVNPLLLNSLSFFQNFWLQLDDYVLCKIIKNADRTRKNSKVGPSAAVSNNSQENVPDSPLEANQNGLAESEIQAPQPLAAYPLSSVQNGMNYPSVPQEMNTYYPQNGFSNALQNGFGYAAERDIHIPQQQQTGIYLSRYIPNSNPNPFINPIQRSIQASEPTPEAIFRSSYMTNGMMYPMERNIQAPNYTQPDQSLFMNESQITSIDASDLVDYDLTSFGNFSSFDPNADWNLEEKKLCK